MHFSQEASHHSRFTVSSNGTAAWGQQVSLHMNMTRTWRAKECFITNRHQQASSGESHLQIAMKLNHCSENIIVPPHTYCLRFFTDLWVFKPWFLRLKLKMCIKERKKTHLHLLWNLILKCAINSQIRWVSVQMVFWVSLAIVRVMHNVYTVILWEYNLQLQDMKSCQKRKVHFYCLCRN